MQKRIEFETPENVRASYELAGAGTRFLAWFADNIFLTLGCLVLLVALIVVGVSTSSVIGDLFEGAGNSEAGDLPMVFIGLWLLVWSLGGFFYFGLSELLMRGQTFGKRMSKIRVVKSDGFALDPLSIFIRSIFRAVDQLPPLWIVPVMSARTQRLGDMVAGTIVVSDGAESLGSVREVLAGRSAAQSQFRFTSTMLERARPADFVTIESLLERWSQLPPEQQRSLSRKITAALAKRLQTDSPEPADYRRFLEDLLAAEYRRQSRKLG